MTKKETWKRLRESGIVEGEMPSVSWELEGADLRGVDLIGANLAGAHLRRANLAEVNLTEANLNGCTLTKAILIKTILTKATLRGTILKGVHFNNANLWRANLTRADLTKADLTEADFTEANLNKASFKKANLSGADISGGDFTGANLNKALLGRSHLNNAIFINATLTNTYLKDTSMIGVDFTNADLSGACIDRSNLSNWIIENVKCSHIYHYDHPGDPPNEITRFAKGEFEKKYTYMSNILDMVLNIPLSGLAYLTGEIVEQLVNENKVDENIKLKSISALSDDSIKLEYISFSGKDDELRKQLKRIEKNTNIMLEKENSDKFITLKEDIDLPVPFLGNFLQIHPSVAKDKLAKYSSQLPPIIQRIITAVQSSFK